MRTILLNRIQLVSQEVNAVVVSVPLSVTDLEQRLAREVSSHQSLVVCLKKSLLLAKVVRGNDGVLTLYVGSRFAEHTNAAHRLSLFCDATGASEVGCVLDSLLPDPCQLN